MAFGVVLLRFSLKKHNISIYTYWNCFVLGDFVDILPWDSSPLNKHLGE